MRKTIACILAAVQLLFAGYLMVRTGKAEQAERARREKILTEGTYYDLALDGLSMTRDGTGWTASLSVKAADDAFGAETILLVQGEDGLWTANDGDAQGTDGVPIPTQALLDAQYGSALRLTAGDGDLIAKQGGLTVEGKERTWWHALSFSLKHFALRVSVLDGDVLPVGILAYDALFLLEETTD